MEKGEKNRTIIHWIPTLCWDAMVALGACLSHVILDWVQTLFGYINFIYWNVVYTLYYILNIVYMLYVILVSDEQLSDSTIVHFNKCSPW